MISYCVAVYRPVYARLLLADLEIRTSAPFELLLWLNVDDAALESDIAAMQRRGIQVVVLGRTPENIGMTAFAHLFRAARYPLIAQIDDDVVCISPGIAQHAQRVFCRYPHVRQLVADVWQDEYTTGARPPLAEYRAFDTGLYDGPIDGWFAVYHRSILPLILGLLDQAMKVFHVVGPAYAEAFGMLEFEIAKYRRLGRGEIVTWYEQHRRGAIDLGGRIEHIRTALAVHTEGHPPGLRDR